MAAAYAALVSLMQIIDQIQRHPCPPISLEKEQVESLTENITFLQDFLEVYSHVRGKEPDPLESCIAAAAYAAEDIIESYIVDRILSRSIGIGKIISFIARVQKVIEKMDSIKKEVMQFKEKMGVQDQLQRNSTISASSLRYPSTRQSRTMVGFDDVFYDVMDKLTVGTLARQIISIVGMGGAGKTTLARNIYESQLVVQHLDIIRWVTISQEYRRREILLELLCQENKEGTKDFNQMNVYELGDELYKSLSGRRYLIIIDDIWDIEAWDQLKLFLPDNENCSRIVLTSRLLTLVMQLAGSYNIKLKLLDEDNSWNLLCKSVFGEEDCPLELEDIGRKIANNCKGLPLSIIVIGGLLAKSEQTRQHWKYIAEHLNSIVNLEDNERCLQVLYMSYHSLPIYLKPCFLYMGVFREDSRILVYRLIKRWVAEGFIKPVDSKSLEEVARYYLEELVGRNLILIEKRNYDGKLKLCKIHDLMRDLCLREAKKQKFLCVLKEQSLNIPQHIDMERRICFYQDSSEKECLPQVLHTLESASLARSLKWESEASLPSHSFRLLRVCSMTDLSFYAGGETCYEYSLEAIFRQVNLRYLSIEGDLKSDPLSGFPSSISLLWNLQTLIVHVARGPMIAPPEIWKMPQLRHVIFRLLKLPDPTDDIVLENLQTLSDVCEFRCTEMVVKKIPNIKKLEIYYHEFEEGSPICDLRNLDQLQKLDSLRLICYGDSYDQSRKLVQKHLTFPPSLKKLTLKGTHLHWEDIMTKICSLPLEVLKMKTLSFNRHRWVTFEGQFCNLKFLKIEYCDVRCWKMDESHFPRLKRLVLKKLRKLKEIPSSLGDITTLQLIKLKDCSNSAVDSAKRMQKEKEEQGNMDFQVLFSDEDDDDDELEEDDDYEEGDEDEDEDEDDNGVRSIEVVEHY